MPDRTSDTILTRSSEIWFDSGTHVLLVGMTLFRIHGDLLCAASSAFRDMFSLIAPGEMQDTYDGCALVEIPQETDEDMTVFLLALYRIKLVYNISNIH